MEAKTNMQHLFDKLGDLKSFFVYGQKLVPIFQKIIDFMHETVPLLENVNQSIQESTSKIPKAAHQLDNVSSATEVATTEILDVVDGVSNDLQAIQARLKSLESKLTAKEESIAKLVARYPNDPDVGNIFKTGANSAALDDDVNSMIQMVDKIQEGMMNITLSLQVQDITAQQLLSVNHMITSIQSRLSSLLVDLGGKETKELPGQEFELSNNTAFNPDARYDRNHNHQVLADTLAAENSIKTSQKEIDKLFANK